MFDYFNYFNGTGVYNPFINYSWSQTLTVGNNQQIKDTGKSGLNLQQYFGQGVYFNGVDQNINIGTFNSLDIGGVQPELTICAYSNSAVTGIIWNTGYASGYAGATLTVGSGVLLLSSNTIENANLTTPYVSGCIVCTFKDNIWSIYINGELKASRLFIYTTPFSLSGSQVLSIGSYRLESQWHKGLLKDVYLFKRQLTQVEIDKYNNQPNQFFTDSLVDDSCVVSMPMCEKDAYVRNYKRYIVSSTNLVGVYLSTDYASPTPTVGTTTITSGVITQTVTTIGSSTNYPRIDFGSTSTRLAGKAYLYEFEYEVLSGVCVLSGFYNGVIFGAQTLQGKGKVSVVSMGTIDRTSNNIYLSGMNLFSVKIWNVSVKEVTSGIHKLTNYTAPSRTSAQRLPYGLQTSGFKRDNLGMILSKSNFLEADGVGCGNTGWIPSLTVDFSIEYIFKVANDFTFRLSGNDYNNGVYFGSYSGGTKAYVRVFNSPLISMSVADSIICLSVSYNRQTKEVKQYINGILFATQLAISTSSSALPVLLGMVNTSGQYALVDPIRLFKVHQKVLTQEEVTKNFNIYTAQGLLSESGESISALVQ